MIKILKKTNLLIAAVLVLLTALIFIGGSYLNIAFAVRAAIAVVLILVAVIVLMYRKMKEVQKAGNIEQSINLQAESQLQNLSPEKKAEIEQFKKQLEAAIASLKSSKIGRGKPGKAALYALPWYMVIGPPAAGKTTAIQNSGLEFPFSKEGFRGVGGTRNCDWFFSTKGIFLDTAGRYVSQSEDKAEWQSFLGVLKKNRRKRPVNGVIAAINIDEIINSSKARLSEHSKNIRQRIDELIELLGVNFPVYIIFTKCDLIQGFVEYFSDLSETERSQVWGATFPFEMKAAQNAKELFEKEFQLLSGRLFDIRTIRLSGPLKREERRKVYLFPFQFRSLQQKLAYFITELFQDNPYADNPVFRGFYFTSGTQEGVPLDIAIREIARQFNLPEQSHEGFGEVVETKNYFIKDLLNDIVIRDQHYNAGEATSLKRKNSSKRLAVAAGSAAFLVLFLILTYTGYNGSSSTLDKIHSSASSFNTINWESGSTFSNFKKNG